MVVKEIRGRRRYILFSISDGITKESLIRSFRTLDAATQPYIVQCIPGKVIIRCGPDEREDIISTMSRVDPSSVSLLTSGTLRTLRDRYPDLKTPKKRST